MDGVTGEVAFNDDGDRINPAYEIINIQENGHGVIIGHYGREKVSVYS